MNRDYRDYPASIWDAIGDVDQGICCAALGGVVWDFMSHLTPAQLLAAMDSAALETLRAIREADVLIGLASSGVHSNGYSLVRRIISDNGLDLKQTYGDMDRPLGEVLLTPTRLYPKAVLPVMQEVTLKGLVHITGGGFYDNIPRVLPEGTRAVIDADTWPLLPVFPFLMKEGGVEAREMYRTFNCGIGMLLILAPEDAARAKDILAAHGEAVYEIGHIEEGPHDVVVTGGLFHE